MQVALQPLKLTNSKMTYGNAVLQFMNVAAPTCHQAGFPKSPWQSNPVSSFLLSCPSRVVTLNHDFAQAPSATFHTS